MPPAPASDLAVYVHWPYCARICPYCDFNVVRDRGRGFNLAAVESNYNTRGSLGLLNMRERARLIGGECRIRSAEGEGSTVEVRVPLS